MVSGKCVIKPFSTLETDIKASFDTKFVADTFQRELSLKLSKKGLHVETSEGSAGPEDFIIEGHFVKIDEGSRVLRYTAGLAGMAIVEVKGQVTQDGSKVADLHYKARGSGGAFGGSGQHLLEFCAKNAAKKIAKQVLKAIK